jgi:hypothetical protein
MLALNPGDTRTRRAHVSNAINNIDLVRPDTLTLLLSVDDDFKRCPRDGRAGLRGDTIERATGGQHDVSIVEIRREALKFQPSRTISHEHAEMIELIKARRLTLALRSLMLADDPREEPGAD